MADVPQTGVAPPEAKEVTIKSQGMEEKQAKEVKREQIFDLMSVLRLIISHDTTISVTERDYDVSGYGPNAWTPTISDKIPCRYQIISIGRDAIPYVVRQPITTSNVKSIDDIFPETYANLRQLLDATMVFLKEPSSMRFVEARGIEPEGIGFPYGAIIATNANINAVQTAIRRYVNPQRRPENFNYSDGFVFTGAGTREGMIQFFDISQREMRVLGNSIEEEELRVRNGIPDSVRRPLPGQNNLYAVVMNPFILTNMFRHIPRPIRLSTGLIIELQKPDVILTPIDVNVLQKTASTSMVKSNSVSALYSIEYTPDMSTSVNAFFITAITPGLIQFEVDLSDLHPDDHPIRVLAALGGKLLFAYANNMRWTTLTPRGMGEIENAIAKAGLSARVLVAIPGALGAPLDRVHPAPDVQLRNYAHLRSDGTGAGWRNGPAERYIPHPAGMPYADCSMAPRIATDLDEERSIETPDRTMAFNGWQTSNAAAGLLSCLTRSGEDKSSYSGVPQVFKVLSGRIFNFYIKMNDYNRLNWYSSLRFSHQMMDELYGDNTEEPTIVPITGKTILYLMKALSQDTQIARRVPYLTQVKAECGLARDCVESAIKRYIFDEIRRVYHVPADSFTSSDVLRIIKPADGPLSAHLSTVIDAGLGPHTGPFYECVLDSGMYRLQLELAQSIIANPVDYGLLPNVHMSMRVADRTVASMRAFSTRNLPYTNIGLFEDPQQGDPPMANFDFNVMARFITTYNLQQTLRDQSVTGIANLMVPFSYRVFTTDIISDTNEGILQTKYDPLRADNNMRHCLSWTQCNINITDIDHARLDRPDLYIKNFSTIDKTSIPRALGARILMSLNDWLNTLNDEAVPCVYVATNNVIITSIFERK